MTKYKKKKRHITFDEIMGRGTKSETHYSIEKRFKELTPKALPKTGDTVELVPGGIPDGDEYCVVYDHMYYEGKVENWTWKPSKPFYAMQIVSFYVDSWQYDYQIQPTDKSDIGQFVFIQKRFLSKQPGVKARTSKEVGRHDSFISS